MQGMRRRLCAALVATGCATGVVACGGDDDDSQPAAGATPAAAKADLQPVKDFLLEHTASLTEDATQLREGAEAYYAMAEEADFDYAQLLKDKRADVKAFVKQAQEDFTAANPAYEQMEGVVAGVPSLADYDVIIDAGADKSDPENAAPFTLKTPAGKTCGPPGQLQLPDRDRRLRHRAEVRRQGRRARPRRRRQGRASASPSPTPTSTSPPRASFEKTAKELDAAAKEWAPTEQDAFTALVVMTPTMSEYFDAWKNSRFVAGGKADEKAFVAASRLQDIADILGGLVTVYDDGPAEHRQRRRRPGHADQADLSGLHRLRRAPARRRRPAASSSPPTTPRRSAPRRRAAPRRSPGRSRRRPASWTSSWSPSRPVRRLRPSTVAAGLLVAAALVLAAAAPAAAQGDAPWQRGGRDARRARRRADRADPRRSREGAVRGAAGGPRVPRRPAAPDPRRGAGGGRRRARRAAARPAGGRARRRSSARGRARRAPRRAVPRLYGGDARRRAQAATSRRRAPGCWCASSAPRRGFTRPGSRRDARARATCRPGGPTPGAAAEAVQKDLLDAYQGRLRELLADADAAARARAAHARWPRRPRRPPATGRSSRRATSQDRGGAAADGARRGLRRARRRAAPAGDVAAYAAARARATSGARRLHRRAASPTRSPRAAPSSCCASSRSCRSSTAAA